MIDRSLTIDDRADNHGEPAHAADLHTESLQQRVHRLEDAVAALQDTHIMEDRVTERVLGKVSRAKDLEGTGIVEAERRTAPPATVAHPSIAQPVATAAPSVTARTAWVAVEVFRDIRTGVAMFFDPRYRVSWGAYFAMLLLFYVLVSHWLWSLWAGIPLLGLVSVPLGFPVVGAILDKALGLVFALFAFTRLAREMRRYQAAIAGQATRYSSY
jgi:hypothetical protein